MTDTVDRPPSRPASTDAPALTRPTLAAAVSVEPVGPNGAEGAESSVGSHGSSRRDVFLGHQPHQGRRGMFGGQLVGQAVTAASRTVALPFHSLHSCFLHGGDSEFPVVFHVRRLRDSRSFATRRVEAYQHNRLVFELTASFTAGRSGIEHADPPPPDVPAPETVTPLLDHLAAWAAERNRAVSDQSDATPTDVADTALSLPSAAAVRASLFALLDFRPVSVVSPLTPTRHSPTQQVWFRAVEPLADDPALHASVLAYASDLYLLATSLRPHGLAPANPAVSFASLDHALWLHRDFRADDWLLHCAHSPSATAGRAISFGTIYTRDGALVATTAQEGVVPPPTAACAGSGPGLETGGNGDR